MFIPGDNDIPLSTLELLFCNAKPQIQKLFDTVNVLPKDRVFTSLEEADLFFYKIMNEEIEKKKV